jgi:hypothetical protein
MIYLSPLSDKAVTGGTVIDLEAQEMLCIELDRVPLQVHPSYVLLAFPLRLLPHASCLFSILFYLSPSLSALCVQYYS